MKIKEKGLTGKAADLRRQNIAGSGRKGFNAFKEMAEKEKGGKKGNGKEEEKPKPEVYLEFLGSRILVHEEDGGGSVKPEDVPNVKGASLKFEGAGEDVSFDEIKVRAIAHPAMDLSPVGERGQVCASSDRYATHYAPIRARSKNGSRERRLSSTQGARRGASSASTRFWQRTTCSTCGRTSRRSAAGT